MATPLLTYEIGDKFTDAVIKSLQARQGFKVNDDTEDNTNNHEVFTNGVKKRIQDNSLTSWEGFKNTSVSVTPLDNMPGWSKVLIGTGAFVVGADIILDIYDAVQNGEPLEHLSPVLPGETYSAYNNVVVKSLISSSGNSERPYLYETGVYDNNADEWIGVTSTESKNTTGFSSFVSNSNYHIFVALWNDTDIFAYWTANEYTPARYVISEVTGDEPVSYKSTVVAPNTIVPNSVPEIDPTKETQVLIVPDPDVFPDPDAAIEENWEMVSDPEGWLENNEPTEPQYDELLSINSPQGIVKIMVSKTIESNIRCCLPDGSIGYMVIVPTDDPTASMVRINTSDGIMAFGELKE